MKSAVIAAVVLLSVIGPDTLAFSGLSIELGMEYLPIARIEYSDAAASSYDVFDNLSWESGINYHFPAGFSATAFFSVYQKKIAAIGVIGASDLSAWGIGLVGDYAYEITESGNTSLIGGMETGYGEFTDNNEHLRRTAGSVWVAGIGGLRHFFTARFFLEFDFRMKWLEYDFPRIPEEGKPQKNFDFSGSTVRITAGYGFLSSAKSGKE